MRYQPGGAAPKRPTASPAGTPLWRRVGWLLVLWSASVLALGVVATLFRLMMTAAGMRTH